MGVRAHEETQLGKIIPSILTWVERLIWDLNVWGKQREWRRTAAPHPVLWRGKHAQNITLCHKNLMVSFKPWLTSHSSPSSFSLWRSGAADLTDTQHKGTWTTQWQEANWGVGWVAERCVGWHEQEDEVAVCVHVKKTLSYADGQCVEENLA